MQILKQLAKWDFEMKFIFFLIFEFYTYVHSLDCLGLLIQAMVVKTEHPTTPPSAPTLMILQALPPNILPS